MKPLHLLLLISFFGYFTVVSAQIGTEIRVHDGGRGGLMMSHDGRCSGVINAIALGNSGPFNRGDFFAAGNQFEDDFIENYPHKLSTINSFYRCFTYGGLQEQIVLDALGLPHNNTSPSNFGGKPDAYGKGYFWDFDDSESFIPTTFYAPIMVEIKARYANDFFDYTSINSTQFNRYLDYLSDPNNVYRPNETISHALIMVLPSGIEFSPDDIEKCSRKNIPFYIARVQKKVNTARNPKFLTRVTPPNLKNADKLDYSYTNARRFPYWLVEVTLEYRTMCSFDYNVIEANFENWANDFEQSYLIPSSIPSDAEEECEDRT
ncbi:hypothetical protein SAMN05444359_11034 [Neolewinella agarilytica]|uniref:Uncharacterized protein n=2 Tax=Neolewinella agarilytica TaxID=478744 RepID=A0A1H9G487_9BACT|nr:hypothetical protein SAMN05444359_11034 [Neolewinella agarilytica]